MAKKYRVRIEMPAAEYKALRDRAHEQIASLKAMARDAMKLGLVIMAHADSGARVVCIAPDGKETELHIGGAS